MGRYRQFLASVGPAAEWGLTLARAAEFAAVEANA